MKIKIFSIFLIFYPVISYATDLSFRGISETAYVTKNKDRIYQNGIGLQYQYNAGLSLQSSLLWGMTSSHDNGVTGQIGFTQSVSDTKDIAVNMGGSNQFSDYISRYYVNVRLEYYINDAVSIAPIYKEYHFGRYDTLYQAGVRTTVQKSFSDFDIISYVTPMLQNQSDSLEKGIDIGTGIFTHDYGGYGVSFVAGQGTYQSNMQTYLSKAGVYYGLKPKFSYAVTMNTDLNMTADFIKLPNYSVYAGGINILYHF